MLPMYLVVVVIFVIVFVYIDGRAMCVSVIHFIIGYSPQQFLITFQSIK